MHSDLIKRIEAADGPSRELDAAIIVATDWKWPDWEDGELTPKLVTDRHGIEWLTTRMIDSNTSVWRNLPAFTSSIDAAMTLVPDASWEPYGGAAGPWNITLATAYGAARVMPTDGESVGIHDKRGGYGTAATPALAICAAALRAREETP